MVEINDRYRGAMVGVTVGDMVGLEYENMTPEQVASARVGSRLRHRTYVRMDQTYTKKVECSPGTVSDDSTQTILLAESLASGFSPREQFNAYKRAFFDDPDVIGWGPSTIARLQQPFFESDLFPDQGGLTSDGSLMRTIPIPLRYRRDQHLMLDRAATASAVTHNHPEAMGLCQAVSLVTASILRGEDKADAVLSPTRSDIDLLGGDAVAKTVCIDFNSYEPPRENHDKTWYQARTAYATSMRAFVRGRTFEEVVDIAVNSGGDTDTNAAIAGGLAGAYYGLESIPFDWRDVPHVNRFMKAGDDLLELSNSDGL